MSFFDKLSILKKLEKMRKEGIIKVIDMSEGIIKGIYMDIIKKIKCEVDDIKPVLEMIRSNHIKCDIVTSIDYEDMYILSIDKDNDAFVYEEGVLPYVISCNEIKSVSFEDNGVTITVINNSKKTFGDIFNHYYFKDKEEKNETPLSQNHPLSILKNNDFTGLYFSEKVKLFEVTMSPLIIVFKNGEIVRSKLLLRSINEEMRYLLYDIKFSTKFKDIAKIVFTDGSVEIVNDDVEAEKEKTNFLEDVKDAYNKGWMKGEFIAVLKNGIFIKGYNAVITNNGYLFFSGNKATGMLNPIDSLNINDISSIEFSSFVINNRVTKNNR